MGQLYPQKSKEPSSGSSLTWDVRDSAGHLPQLLQKGELENNNEIKVARVYFASKKTVHAYHGLSKTVSKERGMNERVILNLIIIFEVFFPVHTCKS